MQEGTTADSGCSRNIDERATRARDLELVRALEANGLTLLAVAVARRVQHPFDRVADQAEANPGRDCQIFVLDTRRSDPGRRGGHGTGGRGHHPRSDASATDDMVIAVSGPRRLGTDRSTSGGC
jgi:hypothetical protein